MIREVLTELLSRVPICVTSRPAGATWSVTDLRVEDGSVHVHPTRDRRPHEIGSFPVRNGGVSPTCTCALVIEEQPNGAGVFMHQMFSDQKVAEYEALS